MGKLTIINPPQQGSLESTIKGLSAYENAICEQLNRFNQLRAYPLSAVDILEWKDSIVKFFGQSLDLGALEFAIDQLIFGNIEYDKNTGIQNIFSALKDIVKDSNGDYKLKDFTW